MNKKTYDLDALLRKIRQLGKLAEEGVSAQDELGRMKRELRSLALTLRSGDQWAIADDIDEIVGEVVP